MPFCLSASFFKTIAPSQAHGFSRRGQSDLFLSVGISFAFHAIAPTIVAAKQPIAITIAVNCVRLIWFLRSFSFLVFSASRSARTFIEKSHRQTELRIVTARPGLVWFTSIAPRQGDLEIGIAPELRHPRCAAPLFPPARW